MRFRKIIDCTVRNPGASARRGDLLMAGAPLPRGAVTDARALALRDARGRLLPCQADRLARWADGSVKWALLTVPKMDVAGGTSSRLTLGARPVKSCQRCVTVRRAGGNWRVTTDCLRFTVAAAGPLIPVIEYRRGKRWQRRAAGLDLAMTVEQGNSRRRFLASRAPRAIEVEQAGPWRVLLCIRGAHQAEDGACFGPYTLRVEVIAKRPQVRLTHSFVYDGDPDRDFVRVSEVVLKAVVGRGRQMFGFGGDAGHAIRCARQRALWCPDFRYAELCQDSVSHWQARRWVDRRRSGVFCEEGGRSDGWMELAGDRGRVAVAVREFWQNHPKTLAADAATGEMRVQLYPERAEPLNLRRYSECAYPRTYEHPAFIDEETVPADPDKGARGIRKTHDLVICFDERNPSAAALAYNEPLLLEWPPRWTARTGVVVPAAPAVNRAWAKRAAAFLDFLWDEMPRSGGTGYLDYFDLPHGFNSAEHRWHHDFGGWGYVNDEAMPCLGLWQAWLLTGRREAFALARAMGRHNGDIDSYMAGKWAGYGSRHNVNHWGDGCKEPRVSQPIGKRFAYYLAGDRSVLDLNRVVLETFVRRATPPRHFNMTCDLPAFVAALLLAEETGAYAGDAWLRRVADALAASVDDSGRMRAFLELDARKQDALPLPESSVMSFQMFSCFGGAQIFAELAERYDHKPLRDALVRFAYYQMLPLKERSRHELARNYPYPDTLNTFRAFDLLAYAYQVTGDAAIPRHFRRYAGFICVRLKKAAEARYGVPMAARRVIPVGVDWPDARPFDRQFFRRHFPLFTVAGFAQLVNMAVYLHKLQGIMLLAEALSRGNKKA